MNPGEMHLYFSEIAISSPCLRKVILSENVIFHELIIKNPQGGNFSRGAVWHTIIFKVSKLHFVWAQNWLTCRFVRKS